MEKQCGGKCWWYFTENDMESHCFDQECAVLSSVGDAEAC